MATVTASRTATASLIPTGQDFLRSSHIGANSFSADRIREILVRKQIEGLNAWFRTRPLSESVLHEVERILEVLEFEYGVMSRHRGLQPWLVPIGSYRDDGFAMLSWNHGSNHFEAEFLPEGEIEWFFWDRAHDSWEDSIAFASPLNEEILSHLDRIGGG